MLKKTLMKAALPCLILFAIVVAGKANPAQPTEPITTPTNDSLPDVYLDEVSLRVIGIHDSLVNTIPAIRLNTQANSFVKKYVKENAMMLEKLSEKYPHYFSLIDTVFAGYGLPKELKYLAIIESKLKVTAVSRAGAVGAWQMMASTARLYSLRITSKYDERKNFYKSTVAAAKMLSDLYNQFGDWLLVIAAYNSGPGGVYKAIKKSGSKNFWKLQHFLPAETRAHVKRFIGTHYYYELTGSAVTMTKDEANSHKKKMQDFVNQQNQIAKARLAEEALQQVNHNLLSEIIAKETSTYLEPLKDKP